MTEASKSAPRGRSDNVETNHYRRILKKEWNRGNPLAANFELTFRCNLKWEFFYNVDDPVSRELTTPQSLVILLNLKSLGVLYCALPGGE
ncbi:MAG: hypothetical protein O7D35_00565, partial [Acidobacteria bacterium]|nr:hypothetical protein [Acidobacteriota bacterium]